MTRQSLSIEAQAQTHPSPPYSIFLASRACLSNEAEARHSQRQLEDAKMLPRLDELPLCKPKSDIEKERKERGDWGDGERGKGVHFQSKVEIFNLVAAKVRKVRRGKSENLLQT